MHRIFLSVVPRGPCRNRTSWNDIWWITETGRSSRKNPGRGFAKGGWPEFHAQETGNKVNIKQLSSEGEVNSGEGYTETPGVEVYI